MKGIESVPFRYMALLLAGAIILAAFFGAMEIYQSSARNMTEQTNATLHGALDKSLEETLKR